MVNKKSFIICSTVFVLLLSFVSCKYGSWNPLEQYNNVDNRISVLQDITDKMPDNVKNCSNKYSVVVFADLHYGSSKEYCPEEQVFKWLDKLKTSGSEKFPKFAISLGDSADTGSQNNYAEYLSFCNKLKSDYEITMINIPGNHDLYQGNWMNWKMNCFPYSSFYRFQTDKFSWYGIDTASGSIGLKQYKQLKTVMESDPRPKIVYCHYPILEFHLVFGLCDATERNLLIDLFVKNNVVCSLGGHNHYYSEKQINNYKGYSFPSFRYQKQWTLLTVDENSNSVSIELIQ